jgi:hypothetical protein
MMILLAVALVVGLALLIALRGRKPRSMYVPEPILRAEIERRETLRARINPLAFHVPIDELDKKPRRSKSQAEKARAKLWRRKR